MVWKRQSSVSYLYKRLCFRNVLILRPVSVRSDVICMLVSLKLTQQSVGPNLPTLHLQFVIPSDHVGSTWTVTCSTFVAVRIKCVASKFIRDLRWALWQQGHRAVQKSKCWRSVSPLKCSTAVLYFTEMSWLVTWMTVWAGTTHQAWLSSVKALWTVSCVCLWCCYLRGRGAVWTPARIASDSCAAEGAAAVTHHLPPTHIDMLWF